jgi:Cof subfamily protein (haloacid dehalogenase superfamily)
MIVTDLDGTLLNREGKVSEENLQAIRDAMRKGIHVVVATGRSHAGATEILKEAGFRCPLIHLNGACIRTEEGSLIRTIELERDLARQLHQIFQEIGIYHEIYTERGIYANRDGINHLKVEMDLIQSANPTVQPELLKFVASKQFRTSRVRDAHFEDVLEHAETRIYKVLAFSMVEKKLREARQRAKSLQGLVVTSSAENNIEINHPDAQKGEAVSFYAEHVGIPLSEVMVIGDNYNDLSMMKVAGVPVAMGNAEEPIKRACRYVTKTNYENGVAHAIRTWALGDGIEASEPSGW